MDTGAIIAIVFVVVCIVALWGGIMYAIYYDSKNPSWFKPKDSRYVNVKRAEAEHSPDA